ncbi:hypothetical protein B8W74_00125 [Arthrobacter agilis]|nr:hypothetical protein B8W74_00125 [Arthrobacter agilis]
MHAVNGTPTISVTPARRSWWGVVAAGALISAATAPGQTAGLSPLTDPLISTKFSSDVRATRLVIGQGGVYSCAE